MRKIPVTRPPACPECGHPEMHVLDWFVVDWQFKCPACLRGFQQPERPKAIGWEKVDYYFDFTSDRVPFPEPEDLYDSARHFAEEVQLFLPEAEEED